MNKEQQITVDGLKNQNRTVNIFEEDWVVLGFESPSRNYLYHACKNLQKSIMSVNLTKTCPNCEAEIPKGVKLFMKLTRIDT